MSQTIWTLGFRRSGNTWLCRLLGDALDSQIASGMEFPSNADEGFDRPGPFVIRMRHYRLIQTGFPNGQRLIHIIRDPRDVLVSVREYWKTDWPGALERMKDWQSHVRTWINLRPLVRFEDLLTNTEGELLRLLDELDLPFPPWPLSETVERQSWRTRLGQLQIGDGNGLPYGAEHQLIVLGHGRAGRWREVLPPEVGRDAHKLFWPLMQELGYENEPRWMEELQFAF